MRDDQTVTGGEERAVAAVLAGWTIRMVDGDLMVLAPNCDPGMMHPSASATSLSERLLRALATDLLAASRLPPAMEMSAEFTDSARGAIAWVLYHHQGGKSAIGQHLRFALGMGANEPLPEHLVAEAMRWAECTGSTTSEFSSPAPAMPDGVVYHPWGWTLIDNTRSRIEWTNVQHVADEWRRDPRHIVQQTYVVAGAPKAGGMEALGADQTGDASMRDELHIAIQDAFAAGLNANPGECGIGAKEYADRMAPLIRQRIAAQPGAVLPDGVEAMPYADQLGRLATRLDQE